MSIGLRALHGKSGRRIALKFALAGGTSPLAKDLTNSLLVSGHEVTIFSRTERGPGSHSYEELDSTSFDVLVNLIGGHSSSLNERDASSILSISEALVNVATTRRIPLVHLSSGSVLGPLDRPASAEQPRVKNHFTSLYQEVKVRIEELHDAKRHHVPISDLRLFSFAGKNFLTESDYFLSTLWKAAEDKSTLRIAGRGFLRDFTGPKELAKAIEIAGQSEYSGAVNLHSDQPATRSEILEIFEQRYGLNFDLSQALPDNDVYCASKAPGLPGFSPRGSLEVILSECAVAIG